MAVKPIHKTVVFRLAHITWKWKNRRQNYICLSWWWYLVIFEQRVGSDTLPLQLMTIYTRFPSFLLLEQRRWLVTQNPVDSAKNEHHYNNLAFIWNLKKEMWRKTGSSSSIHNFTSNKYKGKWNILHKTNRCETMLQECIWQLKKYISCSELFTFNIVHFRFRLLFN